MNDIEKEISFDTPWDLGWDELEDALKREGFIKQL